MKTPRVEDFDPKAKKEPTLKSSLDHMPEILTTDSAPSDGGTPSRTPYPSSPVPSGVPRPVPHQRRKMRQRQPFDIYEDQYETLKSIAEDERTQGLPGSMSRMVREGIDMYLAARKKEEK